MKLKVTVLAEDIDKGQQGARDHCPVAYALKRIIKAPIGVDMVTAEINELHYELPKKVQRFIKKFDKEGKEAVDPLVFELTV